MATFAADILSTLSGPPGDGGVRNVRATSLNSTGNRKGFSSVLRSVRGEAGRATTREAKDARPVNQTHDGSRAKEMKGIKGSTQPDRPPVSSQKPEGTRTSRNDDMLEGKTRTDPESAPRPSEAGSRSQDQGAIPVSGLMFVSVEPEAVDQTTIQIKNEPQVLSDEATVETSSQHPLISQESIESFTTTSEAKGGGSSLNRMGAISGLSSPQSSHQSEPSANDGEVEVPGVEQGSQEVVKDSKRSAADPSTPIPAHNEVMSATSLGSQNPGIPQVVQASVQKTSLEGNVLVAKAETAKDEGDLVDHSVSSQAAEQVHAVGDQHALGASPEQSFSHGRQHSSEGSEQFDELWSGHNGRQMETGEPKISQPFVVDHTIANGSVAESTVPGSSRLTAATPGTSAQSSPVTQVASGLGAEDPAQSAGMPVMRSVVVNVTQPDLGHVNIRVAMTNDVVHTHFSSDRIEVGQFIMNGQDRLQAALQSSGLDMGQFRVDIDRQGAGRSFQQGSFQEQGQPWSHGPQRTGQEPHSDQQDQALGALHGLLNLVA